MKDRIITLPNENLRTRSQRVGLVDDEIIQLIEDMKESAIDWENSRDHEVSVALAAIQIDVNKRVVIIRSDFNDKKNTEFRVFINPKIAKYEGEIVEDFEGCLSVKDIYGKIPRHSRVKVDYKDLNNRDVRITATGFLARIFQHEIDHTNGILIVDRIKDNPDAFYKLGGKEKVEKLSEEEREEYFSILW